MEIGREIRKARLAASLSLTGISILTGISKSNICNIENGSIIPTLPTLERLSPVLGVEVWRLLRRASREALVFEPTPKDMTLIKTVQ